MKTKKFKTWLALALSLLMLLAFAVGCTDKTADTPDPGDDEGWQGNWERPGTDPDDPETEIHICNHACFVCGLCLDQKCEEEECLTKCYETDCEGRERTEFVLNGTDERVSREGGVFIEGTHIGGISQNANMQITWRVVAPEETIVCLGVTVSEMTESNFVTSATPVTVNGEPFYSRSEVPAGTASWTNFVTSWLGCVTLREGQNDIVITNPNASGAYNIQDIRFMTPVTLEWADAMGREVCTHKNEQGLCTDYTSNKYYCLNKDETGWKKLNIHGSDDKVLKYNSNGDSLWNGAENEQCIGYIDGANTKQTIIWSFESTEETYLRLSLETSVNRGGTAFVDLWDLTFNGEPIETEGYTVVYSGDTSAGVYGTYTFSTVAYVKAQPGQNTFMMVHKNTTLGYNIRSLDCVYQSGTLTSVQAEKPDDSSEEPEGPPITEGDAYTIEAETAVLTAGDGGALRVDDAAAASGGKVLGNMYNNYNASFTVNVKAAQDCAAGLYASIAFGTKSANGIFELIVNGENVPVRTSFETQGAADWNTYEEFWLTNVNLKEGNNALTFTVTGACGNVDYLKFVAPCDISVSEKTEEPDTPQDPITGGEVYKIEGESAEFTAGSTGMPSLNAEASADGGKAIGNLCNNYNATLVYTITAKDDCAVGLYMVMALGASHSANIFTVQVNGEAVTVPASFEGIGDWVTYEEFWLANVDLKAGDNTIIITITGGSGNLDYLKFIAPCEISAVEKA